MAQEELLAQVRAKAQAWLAPGYDAETRSEVQRLLDSEDTTELIESFYKDLEFGTGGLRGIMGVGSNRMNRRCRYPRSSQLPQAGVCLSPSDPCRYRTRLP